MNYLTAGESHGSKLDVIIDGVPFGVRLDVSDINFDLSRRSKGVGRSDRQDTETNECMVTSGLADGKTTGNPIHIEIENCFEESNNDESNIPRPGHADINGLIKFNYDDCKNTSERASARETAARVAAGSVAKAFLAMLGVDVYCFVESVGSAKMQLKPNLTYENLPKNNDAAMSDTMCPDEEVSTEIKKQIERAIKAKDTIGGKFKLVATGVLPGLGGYSQAYDRLESKICAAVVSVPSVKGVEVGDSTYLSSNVGSAVVDNIIFDEQNGEITRSSNFSGGIEGGMSNGMPIVVSANVKPVPTIKKPVKTIDMETMEEVVYTSQTRSDTCIVQNAAVVAEAEFAIVLANEYLKKFGCDSIADIKDSINTYKLKLRSFL